MATANHVLLQRITLTASASSITFSGIPQTGYTDLKLVSSVRAFDNNEWMTLTINGATTNISGRYLYGSGTATSSGTISAGSLLNPMVPSSWTANSFSNNEVYICNYTSSNTKSISVDGVAENNASGADMMLSAVLWNSTASITSVGLQTTAGSFAAGSSFSLYGIANAATTPAAAPKADGGDIIRTDGTYWYHTFTGSGIFKPQLNLTCDYLIVAGGGGGSSGYGAGGGAGGYRYFTNQSLSTGNYSVVVGAGGTGGINVNAGTSGGNSQLGSTSATGGGGAGSWNTPNAQVGGSGGGAAAYMTGAAGNAGGYSPPEGYAGGNGSPSNTASGGGGGSGGAGQNYVNTSQSGAGGVGTSNSINGTATFYASGGGGGGDAQAGVTAGSASAGGGSAGSTGGNASAATAYTGGGGGGGGRTSGTTYAGGNGGSGIVIIRYAV